MLTLLPAIVAVMPSDAQTLHMEARVRQLLELNVAVAEGSVAPFNWTPAALHQAIAAGEATDSAAAKVSVPST